MSTRFETPNYDSILAEQSEVQAEKFQGRLLGEYNSYMFPGQDFREPRRSAVVDFVSDIIQGSGRTTLDAVLDGLSVAKSGEPVNWVDMGGGRALPMRQIGSMAKLKQKVKMTNVDLFNFGLDGLKREELLFLEEHIPGITNLETEPHLIQDNIETVVLPQQADIITSIESIQYLNNPLEAVANWYNQLANNGIVIIATEHNWADWIRFSNEQGLNVLDETPMDQLLRVLSAADIDIAVTDECDWSSGKRPEADPNRVRTMAIQKKPGTLMCITKPVTEVWVNPYKFKAVYYDKPSDSDLSIIRIVRADIPVALGDRCLSIAK